MTGLGPPQRSANDVARRFTQRGKGVWSEWYHPGQDHLGALQKSLETKRHLQKTLLTKEYRSILTDNLSMLNGEMVVKMIEVESKAYDAKQANKARWRGNVSESATALSRLVTNFSSYIDPLVPQSAEYQVPYACLMIIFKGIVAKSDKREEALALFTTLQGDLPGMSLRADLFPTDEMKRALAEVYIDCLDLLWRLAKYFTMHSLTQLANAVFPKENYQFSKYSQVVKNSIARLQELCDRGQIAKQEDMREMTADIAHLIGASYERDKIFMDATATSLLSLSRTVEHLEITIGKLQEAQATNQVSALLDIWGHHISDTSEELELWRKPKLKIAPKNRWPVNGILRCLEEWRVLKRNSILWVSSKHDGHDSWMTEFCLDLILAATSQDQTLTYAMCDRPGNTVWTPEVLVKQLICRLLQRHPSLVFEAPDVLNGRKFKRLKTFQQVFQLLEAIVTRLKSVFIVIDRIDCCRQDPQQHIGASLLESLSGLVKNNGKKVRVIVTCATEVPTNWLLPPLPISYFTVDNRKKARKVARKENAVPPEVEEVD